MSVIRFWVMNPVGLWIMNLVRFQLMSVIRLWAREMKLWVRNENIIKKGA